MADANYFQWATLIYLMGYKISLPEVFWYPNFPHKNYIIKNNQVPKTPGKLIL